MNLRKKILESAYLDQSCLLYRLTEQREIDRTNSDFRSMNIQRWHGPDKQEDNDLIGKEH